MLTTSPKRPAPNWPLCEVGAWDDSISFFQERRHGGSMKPHDESEPFFITEKVEAELAAAGYEFEPPAHVRTKSISELYGWRPGETLSDAVNRHLEKCGAASGCGSGGVGV